MIIPIGQTDSAVRRLPWVTFGIMILCFLVFVGTLGPTHTLQRRAAESLGDAIRYWTQHPYLEPGERMKSMLSGGAADKEQVLRELVRQFGKKPPASREQRRREQAHLDRLVDRGFSLLHQVPAFRYGLIPAHPRAFAYLTYMFMHGGWMHLLGNLFILFLTGPFLEDAWGRPLFAALYLASGVFSAFMFAAHYPHLQGPLIGASGAIAGVMGAFLVRFWARRIRFFYWFFFVFHGTFEAPAWLMLGLWLLRELTFAQAVDAMAPGSGGGGTAHWAHVWGFVFGLAVAAGVKRFAIEERFIHPAIEAKITVVDNQPIERAMEVHGAGDHDRALELLEAEVRRDPGNVDAELALWNMAVELGRGQEKAEHARRLIRRYLRSGNNEAAVAVWSELLGSAPGERLDPASAAGVARALAEAGRLEEADRALESLARGDTGEMPPGPLIRGTRLAIENRLPTARLLLSRLAENPGAPQETLAELEAAAADLPEAPAAAGDGASSTPAGIVDPLPGEDDAPATGVEHTLQIMQAVPVGLDGDVVVLRVGEKERRLRLDYLKVVAAAAVPGPSGNPTVLVDLLLDAPWEDRRVLRAVRLLGTTFDPRTLIPGESPVESLRQFLTHLIGWSGATPLPDPESARGRPFRRFGSITEYEREVLGVGRDA
ncbi:MAG: rhomboid family intramembrane serine protease [Acidobacteria bacterium]|nr:rhomboid family intramembrane serine protease [Acidobacteriota bacterium]